MHIRVLGPLLVADSERISPRDRVVLEALVIHEGEYVTPFVLADALWGEHPPATWTKVLQGSVARIRKVTGPHLIETSAHGYRLHVPADELDARRFELLLARAREHLLHDEPDRTAHVVGEALELWRGAPLADLDDWGPGQEEVERLSELRREAEELEVEAALATGRAAEVLDRTRRLVTAEPFREVRWGLRARALYLCGRQTEALDVLQNARRLLREELGLDPGPELVAVGQAILRQDPSLAPTTVAATGTACPYRGLLTYDAQDADLFFGREAEIEECVDRLLQHHVLTVVGPSGSGKSSLVRAGVTAAMRARGHEVLHTTPGNHPLDSLAMLPTDGPRPVLVVDQAEEALVLCRDTAEQSAYFSALAAYQGPLVVAVRADRLGDLTSSSELARLLERGLYLLGGMTESNLRSTIEGPARRTGLKIESGLVDLLVREVEDEPGALPLLSHVLRMTWQHREGQTLTIDGYRATGGVRNAVAQTAEGLYAAVGADRRQLLRGIFLRLVDTTEDGEPVRSRVPRDRLVVDSVHASLIDSLIAARLVSSDAGDLRIAHEALVRHWPRLRNWLAEDVTGLRILRHLATAAEGWESLGRPESELYRGVRFAAAHDWAARNRAELNHLEREFLEAAERREEREAATAEQRLLRQRRVSRQLRLALVTVIVLLCAALIAGGLAVRQRDQTRTEAAAAQRAATLADANRIGLLAAGERDLSRALLLALESTRLADVPETRDRLGEALTRESRVTRHVRLEDAGPLAVSNDSETLVVGGLQPSHGLLAVDTRSGSARTLDYDHAVAALSFLDEGTLAIGESVTRQAGFEFAPTRNWVTPESSREGPLILLARDSYEPLPTQLGGQPDLSQVSALAVGTGGGRFLAANFSQVGVGGNVGDQTIAVWDRRRPTRPVFTLRGTRSPALLGLDDRTMHLLVAATGSRRVARYDLSGRVTAARQVSDRVSGGALSPDGRLLALTVGSDVQLLDARTLRTVARWQGGSGATSRPVFSADSRRLVTIDSETDGGATVWDVGTGESTARVGRFGTGTGHAAVFADDGHTLWTTSSRGAYAWDLTTEHGVLRTLPTQPLERLVGLRRGSPDGSRVAYLDGTGAPQGYFLAQVREVATGRVIGSRLLHRSPGINDLRWHPDGERVVLTNGNSLLVWHPGTGTIRSGPDLGFGHLTSAVFSADGDRLVTIASDGKVALLDADTFTPVRVVGGGAASGVVVGLSGPHVLVTSWVRAHEMDTRTGTMRIVRNLDQPRDIAVSPDGSMVALSSDAGTGLFDVRRERWVRQDAAVDAASVGWALDGQHFAIARDAVVTVYDGKTGDYVASLPAEASGNLPVTPVFDSTRGQVLLAGEDGSLRRWNFDPDTWRATACQQAGRNLTRTEWRELIGARPYRRTCPDYP